MQRDEICGQPVLVTQCLAIPYTSSDNAKVGLLCSVPDSRSRTSSSCMKQETSGVVRPIGGGTLQPPHRLRADWVLRHSTGTATRQSRRPRPPGKCPLTRWGRWSPWSVGSHPYVTRLNLRFGLSTLQGSIISKWQATLFAGLTAPPSSVSLPSSVEHEKKEEKKGAKPSRATRRYRSAPASTQHATAR